MEGTKTENKKKSVLVPVIIGVAVLAVVVVIAVILAGKKDAYRVVKVNSFKGNATYERDEKQQDVFADMNLIPRDVVTTGHDSNIELLADSDKHIAAESDTCFSIEATGNEKAGKITIAMQYGTALYTIDKPLNEDSEFEVETPNATLSVRGTIFRVSYDPVTDTTTVEVLEGKVKVVADTDSRTVEAGESVTVTGDVITDGQASMTGMDTTDGNGAGTDNGEDASEDTPVRLTFEEEMAVIAGASVGDIVTFGNYEQDNDLSNGMEPIEWFVLDKEDGQVTLLSVYVLDAKPYHEEHVEITWENCSLRNWLNSEFYDVAFTETEKRSIRITNVVNEDNPIYGSEYGFHGGNDTTDNVWLLSLGEIERYFHIPMTKETNPYKYDEIHEWNMDQKMSEYALYCYDQDHRVIAKPTAYAQAMGCYALTSIDAQNWYEGYDFSHAEGGGDWWLRSPGREGAIAAIVEIRGNVHYIGGLVELIGVGVRPALKLEY